MTNTNTLPAPRLLSPVSDKQKAFIATLLKERDIPAAVRDIADTVRTMPEGRFYISALLGYPKLPAPVEVKVSAPVEVAVRSISADYYAALGAAEVAKYAVPTRYLRLPFPEFGNLLNNDLLFFEVKTYKGRKYFNRLSGAPGAFNRGRVPMQTATGMLKFIAGRHIEFGKLFSDHYKVCGRCAAELTDEDSRKTGFGPTCRKIFGI